MTEEKAVTKGQLIEMIMEGGEYSLKEAEVAVNLVFDCMANSLKKHHRIEIRGFGSFEVREYHSYVGRNPKTGESVEVEPKYAPFFKPGKTLKQRLNRGQSKK
jgi:integration host factor subunit beta